MEELQRMRELGPGATLPGSGKRDDTGRSRIWPVPVFTIGMIVLSFLVLQPLGFRLGAVPEGDIRARGTAEVESCERSLAFLGLAYTCEARVTWQDEQPPIASSEEPAPVERTVWSIDPLRGSVDVIERGARDEDHRVVPTDHPYRSWLPTALMPAYFVFGIAGFLIGLRLMRKRPSQD